MNPTVGNTYSYNLFANSTGQASSAYYLNKMNSAILKKATGNQDAEIKLGIYPFVYSYIDESITQNVQGMNLLSYLAMGISFIPALITQFLVMEREKNIKHQQIVSGVSLKAYWIANFVMDYLKYLPFACGVPLIIKYYDVRVFLDNGGETFLW